MFEKSVEGLAPLRGQSDDHLSGDAVAVLGVGSAELPRKNCWTIAEQAGEATPAVMQSHRGRRRLLELHRTIIRFGDNVVCCRGHGVGRLGGAEQVSDACQVLGLLRGRRTRQW